MGGKIQKFKNFFPLISPIIWLKESFFPSFMEAKSSLPLEWPLVLKKYRIMCWYLLLTTFMVLYLLNDICHDSECRRKWISNGRNTQRKAQGIHVRMVFSKQGVKSGLSLFQVVLWSCRLMVVILRHKQRYVMLIDLTHSSIDYDFPILTFWNKENKKRKRKWSKSRNFFFFFQKNFNLYRRNRNFWH